MPGSVSYDRDDRDLIAAFAGCSLDESPGSNWVQKAGGLPEYICQIARAIKRTGKTTSQAIAIAVSRVKKWAAGVGVDKDTQAKAAAALAEWEQKRAKTKAKTAAKDAANTVKATHTHDRQVLNLTDYSMDMVGAAWRARVNDAQAAYRKANPSSVTSSYYNDPEYPSSTYVKEIWNSFIIVQSDYGRDADLWKVPYTVNDDQDVTFQEPIEVKQTYVEVAGDDDPDDTGMTDAQLQKLMAATGPCPKRAVDKFLNLNAKPSSVERILNLAAKEAANTQATRYADPGYQQDGKKRYAIDNADQVRAAWSYINQKDNAAKYTPDQLAKVKANIKAAAKKFGVDISDD